MALKPGEAAKAVHPQVKIEDLINHDKTFAKPSLNVEMPTYQTQKFFAIKNLEGTTTNKGDDQSELNAFEEQGDYFIKGTELNSTPKHALNQESD